MPIYEYRCNGCGHEFEAWQKMSDAPVRVCPKCKARKVEKLISQTSFQLKGSGWYVTDYGRRDAGGGKKTGTKEEAGGTQGSKDDGPKPSKDDGSKPAKDDGAKPSKDDAAKPSKERGGSSSGSSSGEKGASAASSTTQSVSARAA